MKTPRPSSSLAEALAADVRDKTGYRFYEEPIKNLLEAMEHGVCPWNNPCLTWPIANAKTGIPYRGFNQSYLATVTMIKNFRSPYWLSFKQTNEFGGHVKQGSRSSLIVYRKVFESPRNDSGSETGPVSDNTPSKAGESDRTRKWVRLLYHRVFNYDQTEGAEIGREPFPTVRRALTPSEAEDAAHTIVAGFKDGPRVMHTQSIVQGEAGSYSERADAIHMRPPEDYPSAGEYWGTLFHEVVHSCGAQKRLDFHRGAPRPRFGDKDYALEELTCEIGSNLLLVRAGLENEELRRNSAAYLRHWKSKIEDNPKLLIWASDRAARAVNLVLGIVPDPQRLPSAAANQISPPVGMPLPEAATMTDELTALDYGERRPAVEPDVAA
jgi:antirestriction protein ArdC